MRTCASSLVCTASAGSAPAWPLVGLAEGSRGSTLVSRSRCAERDCTRAAALEMREEAGAAAAVALSAALVSVSSALKARLYCSDSSGRLPSLTSAAAASASCAAALAAAAACSSAES